MNKKRRKALLELASKLESCAEDLQSLLDEEQEAFDNIPESLQYGDRGAEMENAIDMMETAHEQISEAAESLLEL